MDEKLAQQLADTQELTQILEIAIGTLARVRALEHMVFVLTATHPFPGVALQTWDASLPSWTDEAFKYSDQPAFGDVFRRTTAQHRETLAIAAEQRAKQ